MEPVFASVTTPPYCPKPSCPFHQHPENWRFKKAGFHPRLHPPHRVQRYRCLHCGVTFSLRNFSLDYWSHYDGLFPPVFLALAACSGVRQIGRTVALSLQAVLRRVRRLARHCLLLLELFRPLVPLDEPFALDGFESFAFSQYYPLHLNLLVGSKSYFCHSFSLSPLRRKGRMTDRQKKRRAQLEARWGRPDPRAIEQGIEDLLRHVLPEGRPSLLWSDEHPAYPRALRRMKDHRLLHRVIPSTAPRNGQNPLFPVNLTDLLLRHSSANHKRETIAFSKTMARVAERAAILLVWRNFLKSRSERRRNAPPAEFLGLVRRRLRAEQVLARRLFPSRMILPPLVERHYRRQVPTLPLPNERKEELKRAF